jgi:uncharacterized membrane protein YjjP (DUF1212 family)
MTRHRFTTLLIAIAAAALWASTFWSYAAADDVRSFVMIALGVAAGAKAVYSAGTWRAFWGGFFAAYTVIGSRSIFSNYAPRFNWLARFAVDLSGHFSANGPQRKHLMEHIQATLFLVATVIVATAIGLLCVHIYRGYHRPSK